MGWQDVVAIAAVLAAAGYLASLVWRGVAGGSQAGCGASCGKCSASEPVEVVTIGPAKPSRPDRPPV